MSEKLKTKKVSSPITDKIYALIYCRVSSDRQVREGHGLDSQELRCRQYAERCGYAMDDKMIFKDAASGGGPYTSRQGQVAMLKCIDDFPHRRFKVIVDDPSRIARDVQAHFELRYALKERGVEVESPNFKFDDSPEGELVEGMTAVVNAYHRKNNRRQVIQKQIARLMAGHYAFSKKRGYKMVPDPVHGKVAKPTDAGIHIKAALEGFSNGTFIRKLDACIFLVEKKVWKNRPEKHVDEFTEMLSDVFYAGLIEHPEWEVARRPGMHQGIISMATYEANQVRLAKSGINKRIRKDAGKDFPHRGLIICEKCAGHLTAAWAKGRKKRYGFYWCQNRDCPLYRKSIKKEDVERRFQELLSKNRLKPEVDKILAAVFDRVWKDEISGLKDKETMVERQRDALREENRQLAAAASQSKTNQLKEVYEEQILENAAKLEALQEEALSERIDLSVPYRTALNKAKGMLKNPAKAWQKLDVPEQQGLFFFIFDRKLAYSIETGYRTADIPTAAMLFEEFVATNSPNVGIRGH